MFERLPLYPNPASARFPAFVHLAELTESARVQTPDPRSPPLSRASGTVGHRLEIAHR
jgi:hypothetical protein